MRSHLENQEQIQVHRKLLNRKMKTIQSIGTFNQTPQNFDRSIVCKRDIFLNNPFSLQDKQSLTLSNVSKISKVQSNLNDKENLKSKSVYQSRLKNQSYIPINKPNSSQVSNKSIEKNSLSKSVERHILKPTNTPNFNKFQNIKSSLSPFPDCKSSKLLNQQNTHMQNISLQKELKNVHIQKQNSIQNQNTDNIFSKDLSLKQYNFQNSQASSKFEDYEFAFPAKSSQNPLCFQKGYSNRIFTEQDQRQNTPKKIIFSEQKNSQPTPIYSNVKQNHKKCNCDQNLKSFMEQTSNKMAEITERLMNLQNQNYRLRNLEQKFIKTSKIVQEVQQNLKSIEIQNQMLKQSNSSCQQQKQQLETMLKDILFNRQKQKLQVSNSQSSKPNTYRNKRDFDKNISSYEQQRKQGNSRKSERQMKDFYQNQNNDVSYNQICQKNKNPCYLYRKQNISGNYKKGIEPVGMKIMNSSSSSQIKQKQSQTRMKVQNLLSKLQIKIQKN